MRGAAAEVKRLIEVQERIGRLVLETVLSAPREPPRPRLVAGLDAAYSRRYTAAVGVAAVLDYGSLTLRGYGAALGEPPLPYIPGLLAFREAPVLYTALRAAPEAPGLLVVDGHGLGHPRLAGIASHIGLALGLPSIGVAKKRLYGVERLEDEGCEPPCVEASLRDPRRGIVLGYVVRATASRRLYVTPGAFISPEAAAELVVEMLSRQRGGRSLPAPTREADRISKRLARLLDAGRIGPEALRGRGLDGYLWGRGVA